MEVFLKHCDTAAWLREMLNISARTFVSWSAQALSTHPGMLSSPADLCGLTLARVFLTLAMDRVSTWLSGKGEVFRA